MLERELAYMRDGFPQGRMEKGLRCEYYFCTKIRELFYLFRASYTKRELAYRFGFASRSFSATLSGKIQEPRLERLEKYMPE
jgi:hypothetical protein